MIENIKPLHLHLHRRRRQKVSNGIIMKCTPLYLFFLKVAVTSLLAYSLVCQSWFVLLSIVVNTNCKSRMNVTQVWIWNGKRTINQFVSVKENELGLVYIIRSIHTTICRLRTDSSMQSTVKNHDYSVNMNEILTNSLKRVGKIFVPLYEHWSG